MALSYQYRGSTKDTSNLATFWTDLLGFVFELCQIFNVGCVLLNNAVLAEIYVLFFISFIHSYLFMQGRFYFGELVEDSFGCDEDTSAVSIDLLTFFVF